jgi:pimeloyl-ACP methyl ester carboxylesterase
VVRVIEEVGGVVVGIGLSRGSNLLIRLAAERPQRFSKLVTVSCPLVPGGFESLSSFSDYWVLCPQAHERGDVEGLLRILASYMYTEPGAVQLQRSLIERGLRLPGETVLSFYDPDPDVDVSPILERVRIPTLVTHGREDQLIPFSGAEYLARELPVAELYGFEAKGHLPIFTAPDEFCQVLRGFVAASLHG